VGGYLSCELCESQYVGNTPIDVSSDLINSDENKFSFHGFDIPFELAQYTQYVDRSLHFTDSWEMDLTPFGGPIIQVGPETWPSWNDVCLKTPDKVLYTYLVQALQETRRWIHEGCSPDPYSSSIRRRRERAQRRIEKTSVLLDFGKDVVEDAVDITVDEMLLEFPLGFACVVGILQACDDSEIEIPSLEKCCAALGVSMDWVLDIEFGSDSFGRTGYIPREGG